jgi:7-carboxy-7-deazaguanine synthase
MKTYRIKSIFGPTLQGEGTFAGTVVLFLRFAGCNRWTGLDKDRENSICRFCDTDFRGGEPLTAAQIVERLKAQGPSVPTVVISGGEATLQLDQDLLVSMIEAGFRIHLETNGSKALGPLRGYFEHVTMSPKQKLEECKLEWADDVKLLYPPIHPEITLEKFAEFPARARYLQAVWDKDYEANLKSTICRILGNPAWRLSLQTHKIVGVE